MGELGSESKGNSVVPAKGGTQRLRRPEQRRWVSAFAGTTGVIAASRADALRRKPSPDAENRDAYKSASSRCPRARAAPAPRADRPTIRADGSRTNAASDADRRASRRPAPAHAS